MLKRFQKILNNLNQIENNTMEISRKIRRFLMFVTEFGLLKTNKSKNCIF